MARFHKGELLDPADYNLLISARLECGDPRYSWLNALTLTGSGTQMLSGPVYEIYQIGQTLD